ncbi:cytosol aminopeptidase family, catalytic domain-containing protein [Amylocystis lapponica]|nr:cytosol aminopeptidase family, catalytic domain-containing protein [Amylocystis lapponica]
MLLARTGHGCRLISRPGPLLRASLSSIYVLPIDPNAPQNTSVPQLEPAKLWSTIPAHSEPAKVGTTRLFYGTPPSEDAANPSVTALVSLGDKFLAQTGSDRRELVRKAVGSAVKQVRDLGKGVEGRTVAVDATADPHAAAVAAHLALYKFSLKTDKTNLPSIPIAATEKLAFRPTAPSVDWDTGVIYANSQNFARTLTETPANQLTPTVFTERIRDAFSGIPNVEVIVRDEAWASEQGMRTFLSVTKGTSEPAKFLEIHYNGAEKGAPPVLFVGKGITFDSGGISLKPSAGMKAMRDDMGGAAAVSSAALAIAQLKLPVNLVVLAPLCENMPGPSANKPGDIIYAMNGKSVEVADTDAEGRLVLADALYYGTSIYKPHTAIDVATLTGAVDVALGKVFTGVFTNSDSLWTELDAAGRTEYDRFWRLPLDEDYGPQIYSSNADLCNIGGRSAGSCTAALFLKAFVHGVEPANDGEECAVRWAHLDIGGTVESTRRTAYQEEGITGRPTRALIEFVRGLGAR